MANEEQPINSQLNGTVDEHHNMLVGSLGMQAEHSSLSEMTSITPDVTISEASVDITSSKSKDCGKVKFNQVFYLRDPKEEFVEFMKANNYEGAYDVMHKQQLSGLVGSEANLLKDYHQILFLTGRSEQAAEIRQTMIRLMRENMEVDADEIKDFADQLQQLNKFLDAILFYFVAAAFYKFSSNPGRAVNKIALCVGEQKKSIRAMLKAGLSVHSLAEHQLIPMIREMKDMILTTDRATEQQRCLYATWCAHRIELCQALVKDYISQSQTVLEAIHSMRQCFGENFKEYRVVGHLFNNIGTTYECRSRLEDAARYYQFAIDAYEHATDYLSPEGKMDDIKKCEINLRRVEK
ncbi:uncharacterized protein LOC143469178 isoform X2 [Clavelina lepadiformis]|uniref:uncharacterized protein LOC143469178 isoform X2 n=1 Tax=Clavelina lepadiformis TaxID=159417 RepID=UPI0040429AF7